MRINYYEFPKGTDESILREYCEVRETSFLYNDEWLGTEEVLGILTADGTDPMVALDIMQEMPKNIEYDRVVYGISITTAKNLLKQYGGIAWTHHIDRDGGVFETTPIKLKGNNSKFRYNHHL